MRIAVTRPGSASGERCGCKEDFKTKCAVDAKCKSSPKRRNDWAAMLKISARDLIGKDFAAWRHLAARYHKADVTQSGHGRGRIPANARVITES